MKRPSALKAPYLKRISVLEEKVDRKAFPFDRLPWLAQPGFSLAFPRRVTFFVGENGSGKSTVLEAIAELSGFPTEGGTQDHQRASDGGELTGRRLASALRPEWLPRVRSGFFLRAESFINLAAYIDREGNTSDYWGGRKLGAQSHGESVLAALAHRLAGMERGVLLMDEPEAALSPSRQLAFLGLLRQWDLSETVQVIIATHAPILLCYPDATLYRFDADGIAETTADETEHVRLTRAFLGNPQRYLAEVFGESQGQEGS
jgi:predicted ATPase